MIGQSCSIIGRRLVASIVRCLYFAHWGKICTKNDCILKYPSAGGLEGDASPGAVCTKVVDTAALTTIPYVDHLAQKVASTVPHAAGYAENNCFSNNKYMTLYKHYVM